LLHEYVHLWQQIGRGKDPYTYEKHRKDTHNKEFIAKAEELGIHPMPVKGVHTRIATAGSPIDILLTEMGIARPAEAEGKPDDDKSTWADWLIVIRGGEKKIGKSSLHKWKCPECGLNVRMGKAGDPMLRHHTCETAVGHPVFLIPGDVYVAKDGEGDNYRS